MSRNSSIKRRVCVIVIDAMGIGALPDAPQYNDTMDCNTFCNVYRHNNGLRVPNLRRLGLGNIAGVDCLEPAPKPQASFGRMMEVSHGKDTTTGHWEIAGLILDEPFQVFPHGFPKTLMDEFVSMTKCGGYFGNCAASGTAIIDEFNADHVATQHPIIYTSADSVFQIAVNTDVVPLSTLYRWCEQARELLLREWNVSRVIARPYREIDGQLQRQSGDRRDYAVVPHMPTVMNHILDAGGHVLGIGKIVDIFVSSGVSHAVHTAGNHDGLDQTLAALRGELKFDSLKTGQACADEADSEFIFTNLVDTDALYGHRNDPAGFGRAVEEIDAFLPRMLEAVGDDDLLIITADHGCDPTMPGTDHTREYAPVLCYSPSLEPIDLGSLSSFSYIADTIADWLRVGSWPSRKAGLARQESH